MRRSRRLTAWLDSTPEHKHLWRLVSWVTPFLAELIAARRLPDPGSEQRNEWIDSAMVWLLSAESNDRDAAMSAISAVADDLSVGARNFEAKGVGLLGALSVLIATVVAVGVVSWSQQEWWQKALFILSGVYSVIAFLYALRMLKPRPEHGLRIDEIEEVVNFCPGYVRSQLAARQVAATKANTNRYVRLGNIAEVAPDCVRIACILAGISLVTMGLGIRVQASSHSVRSRATAAVHPSCLLPTVEKGGPAPRAEELLTWSPRTR